MSACDLDALESVALGNLSGRDSAPVLAHASQCPGCGAELALLRRTRSAFAGPHRRVPERVAHLYPAIAERTAARRTVRRQLAGMALTFASLAVVIGLTLPPQHPPSRWGLGGGSACSRQCVEREFCEASLSDELALLEEQFAACLIVTPGALP